MAKTTYQSAGVDLERYRESMSRLGGLIDQTRRPGVIEQPGGFAGLFHLAGAGAYEDPVLVSGTDGVGTKLKIAGMLGRYETIGIDLVAMCVNDCLCLGAEPLFFLDYVALERDDSDRLAAIVSGIAEGCRQSGCALLGGETAVMPGVYAPGEFDLAGFCVGVAERAHLVDGRGIRPGDRLIGLPSAGFHSNGYSLIRKVAFETAGLRPEDFVDELGRSVGEVLLEPTRIYARAVKALLAGHREEIGGMAHITGGGLGENLGRILPSGCQGRITRKEPVPPEFAWLQRLGQIEPTEMEKVFNLGIGFVFVVDASAEERIRQSLEGLGEAPIRLGEIAGD